MMCLTQIFGGKKYYWHEEKGWILDGRESHFFGSAVTAHNYCKSKRLGIKNTMIETHPFYDLTSHPDLEKNLELIQKKSEKDLTSSVQKVIVEKQGKKGAKQVKTATTKTKSQLNAEIKAKAYQLTSTKTTPELKKIFPDINFKSVDGFAAVIARMGRGEIQEVKKGKKIVRVWVAAEAFEVEPILNEIVEVVEVPKIKHEIVKPSEVVDFIPEAEALHIIQCLMDAHDNFTPIYEYRNHMKDYTRQQQDNALYSLIRDGKIEMSSLAEPLHYTTEQIEAGIEQISGGALFYIQI